MADITQITNNLSNARPGAVTPQVLNNLPYKQATLPNQISTRLNQLNTYSRFQFPLEAIPLQMQMSISEYQRTDLYRLATLDPLASVFLPLPNQMVDGHAVAYEAAVLGAFAGGIANALGGTVDGFRKNQLSMDLLKNEAKRLGTGTTAAFLAEGIDHIGALGGVIKTFAGVSPNQFLTILLKGPQYKKHQFSWKLSPRNAQEAMQLNKIIRLLNNSMAPGLMLGDAFFSFPKIFRLSFIERGQETNLMFKFKPAVLEHLNVNYAPAGVPAFHRPHPVTGGQRAPESVEIQMTFQELEFWLRGQFGDDGVNVPVNLDAFATAPPGPPPQSPPSSSELPPNFRPRFGVTR